MMLITPSAKSAAISAQQQPTQKPPCSIPARAPIALLRRRPPGRAAVPQADRLHRGELVQRGAEDHAAGDVRAALVPAEEARSRERTPSISPYAATPAASQSRR